MVKVSKMCRDIMALTIVPSLGMQGIKALLKEAQDTEEIFHMPEGCIRKILRKDAAVTGKISSARTAPDYLKEIDHIEKDGISAVCIGDENYPVQLGNIYDPPLVMYYKGNILPEDNKAVAIVGSRRCSLYGLHMAEKLAFDLAQKDITVISGMARGIDSAAHRGALRGGGRTIAIMGSGFQNIYPPESISLASEISEKGAVVTEYPFLTAPMRYNFPKRNRIISGMSVGVIVVEAAKKSGAMITVNMALDQGKEVFAVPGRADLNTSSGCNLLIQNGAKLVMGIDDVLEELEIPIKNAQLAENTKNSETRKMKQETSGEGSEVISILDKTGSSHFDSIMRETGIDVTKLPETLLKLEVAGKIKALSGKRYELKKEHAY